MKKIKLSQNKYALVDDDDYYFLSRFNWFLVEDKTGNKNAQTHLTNKLVSMQEMILPTKKGFYLKHKNGNNLDNRKENLELISTNHRRHLGRKMQIGSSKYRGVYLRSSRSNRGYWWEVSIAKDKKRYFLGLFKKEDEKKAAKAYNKKARELYGEFAYQNKI